MRVISSVGVLIGLLFLLACGGGDSVSPTASGSSSPTNTPVATAIPTATVVAAPTEAPPENTKAAPVATPAPAATATPSPTATPVPTPTATPLPTATPIPTATPDPLGAMFLDILFPESVEIIIAQTSYAIIGRTRLDAIVSVDDTFAELDDDGRFQVTLQLEEGPNIIDVISRLSSGEEIVEILVIISSP